MFERYAAQVDAWRDIHSGVDFINSRKQGEAEARALLDAAFGAGGGGAGCGDGGEGGLVAKRQARRLQGCCSGKACSSSTRFRDPRALNDYAPEANDRHTVSK